MKQKSEKCLYCDQKLEPKTTRQRFCSDKCRVYWNRDNAKVKISDLTQPTSVLKPKEQPKTNFSINTTPHQKIAPIAGQAALGAIEDSIAKIRAEKIPKERDTPFGRKAWQMDQQKRIQELQKQIKVENGH